MWPPHFNSCSPAFRMTKCFVLCFTFPFLKYLSIHNLRVGTTHMVWKTVESSVTDVKKAVVKARILTGTYILQKNRQTFSNGTVDAVCRHCRLEEEDLLHLLSRCPAFYSIHESTVRSLKDIVISHMSMDIWDWVFVLKTLVWVESVLRSLPEWINIQDKIERLSKDCFYKIHARKLQNENQRDNGRPLLSDRMYIDFFFFFFFFFRSS